MVHGQKSVSAMLAQLILIRYSSWAAGSETTDLRLNSFGSQHFAWTFLALDSNGPKDSKHIPDADWKHAAPTAYRSFPNKTKKCYLDSFQIWTKCSKSSLKSRAMFYVSKKTTQNATLWLLAGESSLQFNTWSSCFQVTEQAINCFPYTTQPFWAGMHTSILLAMCWGDVLNCGEENSCCRNQTRILLLE